MNHAHKEMGAREGIPGRAEMLAEEPGRQCSVEEREEGLRRDEASKWTS